MKINEIYSRYNIMPNLVLHQLRVAAVAKSIVDNFKGEIDSEGILTACLLHDMGNIIKFDLNYFPEFLEPEGLEYWQNIKNSFVEKYGPDEHKATVAIANELGISKEVVEYIQRVGFSNIRTNESDDSFACKICNYADMRVGPHGIITIQTRLEEGRKRYEGRKHLIVSDVQTYDKFALALQSMENQIQSLCTIPLLSITDTLVDSAIEELKEKEIK